MRGFAAFLTALVAAGIAAAAPPEHDHGVRQFVITKELVVKGGEVGKSAELVRVAVTCPDGSYLLDAEASSGLILESSGATVHSWVTNKNKPFGSAQLTISNSALGDQTVTIRIICVTDQAEPKLGHWHLLLPPTEHELTESYAVTEEKKSTLTCRKGSVPISAETKTEDRLRTQSSYPQGQAWVFEQWNQSSEAAAAATLTATCLPTKLGPPKKRTTQGAVAAKPHYLQVTTAKTGPTLVPKGTATTLRAGCPAGTAPIGGGWQTTAGTIAPLGTSVDATGYVFRLVPIQNADAQVAVYAVCLAKKTTKGT